MSLEEIMEVKKSKNNADDGVVKIAIWSLQGTKPKCRQLWLQQKVTEYLLSCLWVRELSREVPAEAGFLYEKPAVLRDATEQISWAVIWEKQFEDLCDALKWFRITSNGSLGY
jgi:hypothetical protein